MDLDHIIIQTDSVLSNLYELYKSNKPDFKINAEKKYIGQTVITRLVIQCYTWLHHVLLRPVLATIMYNLHVHFHYLYNI